MTVEQCFRKQAGDKTNMLSSHLVTNDFFYLIDILLIPQR